MRVGNKVLIGAVALVGPALAGCGGDNGDDDRASRAEPKLITGAPKRGVEYTATFRPRLTLRFPEPGWEVLT